ncbi:MAG: hypothetical protein IKA02_01590 [Clostridia bacterium]|nr:hypothetical protein [Clostridia bacterium]
MQKLGKFLLKILKYLIITILLILSSPFLLINSFILLGERIKYKKSEYYKDFKIKYSRDIECSYEYQLYSYVKANPNIEIIKTNDDFYLQTETTIASFFYYDDIFYDDGKLKYTIQDSNDQTTEYNLLDFYNTYSEAYQKQGKKFKFIVWEDLFRDEKQYELAKQDDVFVIINSLEDYKSIIF